MAIITIQFEFEIEFIKLSTTISNTVFLNNIGVKEKPPVNDQLFTPCWEACHLV